MSNPYIPNTASIPNILFDYWMQRLSPGDFKVLMCIARKTYGWNKANDLISLRQIHEMTNLHKSSVIRSVDILVDLGLVTKIKSKTLDGDDAPNRYEINVDCVEGGSRIMRQQVVASCDKGVVASCDTQNTLYTKPNLQSFLPPASPGQSADAEEKKPTSLSGQKKEPASQKRVNPTTPGRKPIGSRTRPPAPPPPENKTCHIQHVYLTDSEHDMLKQLYGNDLQTALEMLNSHIGSKGVHYISHYEVLAKGGWVYRQMQKDKVAPRPHYGREILECERQALENGSYKMPEGPIIPRLTDEERQKCAENMRKRRQANAEAQKNGAV